MSKKLVFLVILSLIIGGLFYFLFIWEVPKEPGQETSQGPTLFAKEDYRIDEREDGKYIVVEKVGLTCKVPEEWDIKIERNSDIKPQYWVDLFSQDAEIFDILIKGCGINITGWESEEDYKEIETKIKTIEETRAKLIKGFEEYKYEYEIDKISNHIVLKNKPSETDNKFTKYIKGEGLDILFGNYKILSINTSFPPFEKDRCALIWQEFINNIIIE